MNLLNIKMFKVLDHDGVIKEAQTPKKKAFFVALLSYFKLRNKPLKPSENYLFSRCELVTAQDRRI